METYIVNGVEVEYDTFDLDAMELFDGEVTRLRDSVKASQKQAEDSGNYIEMLREQGENILDFFDTVLGEGAAQKIFGSRMNIKELLNGYRDFIKNVVETRKELDGKASGSEVQSWNREQRRAAERQRRREEAAARAGKKAGKANEA